MQVGAPRLVVDVFPIYCAVTVMRLRLGSGEGNIKLVSRPSLRRGGCREAREGGRERPPGNRDDQTSSTRYTFLIILPPFPILQKTQRFHLTNRKPEYCHDDQSGVSSIRHL